MESLTKSVTKFKALLYKNGENMSLCDLKCSPCRGGIPPFPRADAEKKLPEVPGWELNPEATSISRRFSFKNFSLAMAFAMKVGEVSEQEGHHPELTIGWGHCTVSLMTHKIKGLHENDFIMAAKINKLIS